MVSLYHIIVILSSITFCNIKKQHFGGFAVPKMLRTIFGRIWNPPLRGYRHPWGRSMNAEKFARLEQEVQ